MCADADLNVITQKVLRKRDGIRLGLMIHTFSSFFVLLKMLGRSIERALKTKKRGFQDPGRENSKKTFYTQSYSFKRKFCA